MGAFFSSHRHTARLGSMLELAVTATGGHQFPSFGFDDTDSLRDLWHAVTPVWWSLVSNLLDVSTAEIRHLQPARCFHQLFEALHLDGVDHGGVGWVAGDRAAVHYRFALGELSLGLHIHVIRARFLHTVRV